MLIFSILVFGNFKTFKVFNERFDLDTNHRVSKSPGEKHMELHSLLLPIILFQNVCPSRHTLKANLFMKGESIAKIHRRLLNA